MTRFISLLFVGLLACGSLVVTTGCDAPGDGTRWSCATAFNGTAEGVLESDDGDESSRALVAGLVIPPAEGEEEEEWVLEGVFEEIEGPLGEENRLQEFESFIEEDGTLTPGPGIQMSGRMDLDGDCDIEGTWELFQGFGGTWSAKP